MLPIHKILWHELRERQAPLRLPEPESMTDPEQIRAYVKAYEWGGPTSALQLHHLREMAGLIRPGDTVVDLACGPGPLLLELAPLYPDNRFIGIDMSQPMLDVLAQEARSRGLRNVETRCEDIRHLPSLRGQQVGVVVSTSALHHLPDEASLGTTARRIADLLGTDGALYVFDFGLLRSPATMALLVEDVAARGAPPLTATDYSHSLAAAFPIERVVAGFRSALGSRPIEARSSALIDFFYFIQTPRRVSPPSVVADGLGSVWAKLSAANKAEATMLRLLRRRR